MTQNGNGTHPKPDDMDAIVASQFGSIIWAGKEFAIVPITPKTQRFARELDKQSEKKEIDMTLGEMNARVALRCLRPSPTEDEADEIPIAVLGEVLVRASQGIRALERVVSEQLGDAEKNEGAPAETAPTPSP